MKWVVRGPGGPAVNLAAVLALLAITMGNAHGLRGPLELPAPERAHPENALLLDVARAGDRLVAVGEHGVITYSDDQGRSWEQAGVPVATTLTAVSFATAKIGWAAGHSGVVLHTTDGGRTWRKQLVGSRVNELEKARAQRALEQAESSGAKRQRISRLEREIQRAEKAIESGPTRPFLDIRFTDKRTGIAIGGFGLAMRTTDGGRTWKPLGSRIENPRGWHLYELGAIGKQLYIVGERGHAFRSGDQGRTWSTIKSPYKGTYFGITAGGDDRSVVIFGLESRVYRSPDSGKSWQRLSVPLETSIMGAQALPDGGLALVGGSGAVACRPPDADKFKVIRPKGRPLMAVVPVAEGETLVLTGIGGVSRLDIGGEC